MLKLKHLQVKGVNYIKKYTMARVNNLWMGHSLTLKEKKTLTALTLREFKKPVNKRVSPQVLVTKAMEKYNILLRKKFEKLNNYERNTGYKRKGEQ